MTSDLEELVRATLTDHAPSTARPADWATLRSRAARRTVAGRTTLVVGAAAVGTLAVTTPWAAPAGIAPSTVVPAQTAEPTADPTADPRPAQPVLALDPSVVDTALTDQRLGKTGWSTGQAARGTVEQALGTLMASPQITDPTAQPQVIWSSAGHTADTAQGPQALVAVEQPSGWVLGLWDERAPYGDWIRSMSFGTMPGGPLDDRLVGFVVPEQDYVNMTGRHVVYVPPAAATRVVSVVTRAEVDAGAPEPVGTETDLANGFGGYLGSGPMTVRAYAADGTLLDEQTYGE